MCIYEFDEKVFVDGIREEGREEGRIEGRKKDIERMLRSGKTPEQIAAFCAYDLDEVKEVQEQMLVNA